MAIGSSSSGLAADPANGRPLFNSYEEKVMSFCRPLDSPLPPVGEFFFRPYRAGDERELSTLFNRTFAAFQTEGEWRWKLGQRDEPIDNVWIATVDGRPVFQYAGIPTTFRLGRSSARIMVSVDTMTAPEYRRRGLLTQVGKLAYEAWRREGVAFVMGLPNEQWGSRAPALGWRPLFSLQWMVRPIHPEVIFARRLKIPILKRATGLARAWSAFYGRRMPIDAQVGISSVRNADHSFDSLWNESQSDWHFSAVRDRRWVQWRFRSEPKHTYELNLAERSGRPTGYSAHRVLVVGGRTVAQLADLFAGRDDFATRNILLGKLIRSLHADGVEALSTLAVPGTTHFKWLRHLGFIPSHAFTVQIVPLRPDLPMNQLRDPNLWNLSGADFDVI
jgi:Acetyltransferase (GNAT) domain